MTDRTALLDVGLAASTGCVLATFDTKIASALAPADRQHVSAIPV